MRCSAGRFRRGGWCSGAPPGRQVPSKGSLRSSSPLRGSPPLTRPRTAMPFDRHLASRLFAPQKSKTNKWCRFQSRKRQEAELRTRIAKHLSGRVRPPGATMLTSNRFDISLRHIRKSVGISDRNHYLCRWPGIRGYT